MFGKPLIAYTIDAAIQSGLFSRIVVSTDSPTIAGIAHQHGADVPFLRDANLADDHTPVSEATCDALARLEKTGERYDQVAQLMPNCPLRDAEDIRASNEQFTQTHSASQISITRFGWQNPWWAMQRNDERVLDPLFATKVTERSQDLPDLFCPTGAVWWAEARALRQHGTYHIEGRSGWEIAWQHGIDIDTQQDWEMAEILFRAAQQMVTAHGT